MTQLLPGVSPSTPAQPPGFLALFDLTAAQLRQVVLHLVVIWLTTWLGWQLVKLLSRRIVAVAVDHHSDTVSFREKRAKTIAQLLRSAGWGALMVLAVIETLRQFLDITPYLGGVAVVGLAVSFGAQSLVKDYFAGFFILLENQFIVGDSIEAAGKSGVVEKLTLRAVTLRDVEGTVHIIPNGQIATLSNKTRGWSRAVVDVSISYDNDVDQVLAALKQEAASLAADPDWASRLESRPQVLGVDAFVDNGVVIRSWLQTKAGMQAEVAREFRRRVLMRLEHDGIKGSRTQTVIHLQTPPGQAAAGANVAAGSTPPAPASQDSPIPGST